MGFAASILRKDERLVAGSRTAPFCDVALTRNGIRRLIGRWRFLGLFLRHDLVSFVDGAGAGTMVPTPDMTTRTALELASLLPAPRPSGVRRCASRPPASRPSLTWTGSSVSACQERTMHRNPRIDTTFWCGGVTKNAIGRSVGASPRRLRPRPLIAFHLCGKPLSLTQLLKLHVIMPQRM